MGLLDKVKYCSECGKDTKHKLAGSIQDLGKRLFNVVMTKGYSEINQTGKNAWECSKCGEISSY